MALALVTGRPPLSADTSRPVPSEPALRAWLWLLRMSQVGLALMFTTGATLVALVHGAFGRQMWMITSVVLFVMLGGGSGLVQSSFKKALRPDGSIVHVRRAHLSLAAMCVLVAAIAWLMESKPF